MAVSLPCRAGFGTEWPIEFRRVDLSEGVKCVTGTAICFRLKEERKKRFMTLIKVSGNLEAALQAQASQQGVAADKVARRILAQALTPGAEDAGEGLPARTNATAAEKASAFVQWAKSHRYTPPLSDEAISRTSLYPDRWARESGQRRSGS